MAKTPSDYLLDCLEELVPYEFEKFKFKLQNTSLEKKHSRIPRGLLQMARPVKLVTLLVNHYGEEDAVQLTLQVLRSINQRLLAEELHNAINQDSPVQEVGTNSSAASCSPGESKNKSLKEPDGLGGDGQQQSGEGVASPHPSQLEAGRGLQKKCQDRRKEQGLDGPGARSMTPPSRRGPSLASVRLSGEKSCTCSPRLRRNAFSTGRLQDLACHSLSGSLGRRECRRTESKTRPKSLEFAISSGEKGPLNPETLLTLNEIKLVTRDPAVPHNTVAPLQVEATVTPEKGSRNPEHSVIQDGGIFMNALTCQEHPESTVLLQEDGSGSPEAPGMLGETSNPEALQSSERPQEGALVGGTCMHGSCSCSGEHGASGGHSPSCLGCQALLKQQLLRSLSSEPPPQCERHMKQPCLLFCEDHREPVCLICSLSQEHRGHQVRPIEEAALEYQEQIHWQLEHLKELRKSGEEQKYQGGKETANFLKQTEAQKQKVQCQMQQLYRFLEKQEHLLVARLEELGQTIGQVGEKYGSRVSRDIALLDELIGELEAKQCQPAWGLVQGIGVTLHRAKTVTVPEPWATPSEVKEKIHLFSHKSEFVEKSMKRFSESLRSEMEAFIAPELIAAQAHAVDVILDANTAHSNLIISDDLKSVRLGSKCNQLPQGLERFDSCILALGSPTFLSGRQYWEVEVGDKTGWVLGVCTASSSRQGTVALSSKNGYWVVMMLMCNEYQASTSPPTHLWIKEPPRRVGIFLDHEAGGISFYNVTAKSHIYTFICCSSSEPLQPVFSPSANAGGKNMGPLTISPVCVQGPH